MNFATLSQALPPAPFTEFRILPDGVFRTTDGSGRPERLPGWKMDASIAQRIIASLAARDDVLIDYEHQSIKAESNGQPVPAAGWFNRAEYRPGQGLFAVGVRWADRAKAMIASREYRYISPVFSFDPDTGEVGKLISAGLTNLPALTGLADLATALTAGMPARPGTLRESDRGIAAFNQAFGPAGVFHPATPPAEVARLKAELLPIAPPRPAAELAAMSPDDAAKVRHVFPGVWAEEK